MASVNGIEIDLNPSNGMKEEAKRFLQWKDEGRRGGTQTARRRANQILSGNELAVDVVAKMYSWKARHFVDRKAEGFRPNEYGYPSPSRVSHSAWGLPEGDKWIERKWNQIKAARNELSVDTQTHSNMDKNLYFETTTLSRIDRENGEIFGISVISTPEAKGHNLKIDQKSIQSFFDAVEGKQVKAYNTHSNNEGVGDVIGIWENFRIEESEEFTKLLADFSALDSWRKNKEEEYESFFELAEKAPETFGVSAEFVGYGIQYDEDGEEVEVDGEVDGDVYARAREVSAFSIVLLPSANPTGLFSEETEFCPSRAEIPVENSPEIKHFADGKIPETQLVESDDSQNWELISEELKTLHFEKKELQTELKTKIDLCDLLERENKKATEIIEQLESAIEIQKQTESVLREKFEILKNSGTTPLEGVIHEEEDKSISEQIFSADSWIEKQKLFQENITELSKEWAKFGSVDR